MIGVPILAEDGTQVAVRLLFLTKSTELTIALYPNDTYLEKWRIPTDGTLIGDVEQMEVFRGQVVRLEGWEVVVK